MFTRLFCRQNTILGAKNAHLTFIFYRTYTAIFCFQVRETEEAVRRTLGDESTEVLKYFRERTWPILRSNAEHGYPGWTNNNVESINHVLKNVNQWRQHKLPDLIGNIKAAVSMQYIVYADAEKANYGKGEYLLKGLSQV